MVYDIILEPEMRQNDSKVVPVMEKKGKQVIKENNDGIIILDDSRDDLQVLSHSNHSNRIFPHPRKRPRISQNNSNAIQIDLTSSPSPERPQSSSFRSSNPLIPLQHRHQGQVSSASDETKLSELQVMFPMTSRRALQTKLKTAHYDVTQASALLLDDGPQVIGVSSSSSSSATKNAVITIGHSPKKELKALTENSLQMALSTHDLEKVSPAFIPSENYKRNSCRQLYREFPSTPTPYLYEVLVQRNYQFIPAYIHMETLLASENPTKRPPKLTVPKKKGPFIPAFDVSWEREIEYFEKFKVDRQAKRDEVVAQQLLEKDHAELASKNKAVDDPEIECGCCYCDYPISQMTFCEDGHLFCLECARRAAEILIGMRKTKFPCLDSGGCQYHFSVGESKRFLPEKVFECFMRIQTEDEIKNMNIPDFFSCPYCPFGAIVPESEPNLHCMNEECKKVTCKLCHEPDHVPIKCEDVEKKEVADARLKLEEAMTLALLRVCPKCNNKFFKTEGCNKMRCSCGQLVCYVCRQAIKGYDHFDQMPGTAANTKKAGKCPLWDDAVARNKREVDERAKEILQEIQAVAQEQNQDLSVLSSHVEKIIKSDPVPPPKPPAPVAPPPRPVPIARPPAPRNRGRAAPRPVPNHAVPRGRAVPAVRPVIVPQVPIAQPQLPLYVHRPPVLPVARRGKRR